MRENKKQLPRIMADQTQYTSIFQIGAEGIWINNQAYVEMRALVGYAPDGLYIYTQNLPTPFFFAAWEPAALAQETETGFNLFTNKEFFQKFEADVEQMYKLTKTIRNTYFAKYYGKEKEELLMKFFI